jgi:hypothetical protein
MEVLMGKSSINGPFSMAMLNNQRVNLGDVIYSLPPRKHGLLPDLFTLVPLLFGCLCPASRDSASEHS